MLPTVLSRWSCWCSYFVLRCGFTTGIGGLALLYGLVFFFSVLFSIVITLLWEERAGLCASRAFDLLISVLFLLVSGVAAVCDCDTPWTFLLIFFVFVLNIFNYL